LVPIKHGKKNTFVFQGTVLKSVYIHKTHVTAKIGPFSKHFDEAVDKQTETGPFNNQMPIDLGKAPKGKCTLKLEYQDKNGHTIDCQELKLSIH
jgi:hypothetical protein